MVIMWSRPRRRVSGQRRRTRSAQLDGLRRIWCNMVATRLRLLLTALNFLGGLDFLMAITKLIYVMIRMESKSGASKVLSYETITINIHCTMLGPARRNEILPPQYEMLPTRIGVWVGFKQVGISRLHRLRKIQYAKCTTSQLRHLQGSMNVFPRLPTLLHVSGIIWTRSTFL